MVRFDYSFVLVVGLNWSYRGFCCFGLCKKKVIVMV